MGLPNQQLEPFRLTIEPHSGSAHEPISHPGHEFVYCLLGKIEYYINEETYHLDMGDSLLLDASNPHCWQNTSNHPAIILLIFQATLSHHLARLSHLDAEG